jgi:hypothetical protein
VLKQKGLLRFARNDIVGLANLSKKLMAQDENNEVKNAKK